MILRKPFPCSTPNKFSSGTTFTILSPAHHLFALHISMPHWPWSLGTRLSSHLNTAFVPNAQIYIAHLNALKLRPARSPLPSILSNPTTCTIMPPLAAPYCCSACSLLHCIPLFSHNIPRNMLFPCLTSRLANASLRPPHCLHNLQVDHLHHHVAPVVAQQHCCSARFACCLNFLTFNDKPLISLLHLTSITS